MHHSKPCTTPLTLTDVQMQFQRWRSSKTSGRKIPEALWELIATLLSNKSHKRSVIGRALGISTSQFRNKFPDHFNSRKIVSAAEKCNPFVEAPLNVLITPLPSSAQFVIERINGTKLIVSALTQEQFSILIKTFME